MRRARFHGWPLLWVLTACGGKGEAADPSEILGDDLTYRGADGTSPSAAPAPSNDGHQPATRADCERAAHNLVELGYDMAIAAESDPAKQQRLRDERAQALKGENATKLVETWTNECLERGDSKAVADCVARVKSEQDIAKCDPGP